MKEEYDRLKSQMQKTQEETNFAYQKKKGISAERKEARIEKEEADKYTRLKDDLCDKLAEHQLYRLFHSEREMKGFEENTQSKQKESFKTYIFKKYIIIIKLI